MKSEHEYASDLTQIRTMMERSTKFLSLAGWSGIMAGIYGLAATVISIQLINATGSDAIILYPGQQAADIFILAVVTLVLALVTIIGFSLRKSRNKGETAWNPAARRLAFNMAIPLMAGAILIAILYRQQAVGLIPAVMLLFYGAAMLVAGNFTYGEVRYLGIIEVVLGLLAAHFTQYSILLWGVGFGVMHIVYGIYLHVRYER